MRFKILTAGRIGMREGEGQGSGGETCAGGLREPGQRLETGPWTRTSPSLVTGIVR